MNIKSSLKRFFTVLLWFVLGGSGLALLIAAINSKNSSLCQGMQIEINAGGKAMFMNKKDILETLGNSGFKELQNKKVASFDLLKMESVLRRNSWIKDVQIYFDNNQILKLRILERQPAARIFTQSGNSFLIDSSGVQMPLSDRNVFRLPVFMVYPSEKFGLRRDSALDIQIKNLIEFLHDNVFWSNQIQEINISATKNFVMIPLIGGQTIDFGDGNDIENKFRKLLIFYKQVISQTGFEKYNNIKLAYGDQVIATRKGGEISKADSIQARRTVMEMIRMAQKMETDSVKIRDVKPLERNTMTEQNLKSYDLPEEKEQNTDTNHKH